MRTFMAKLLAGLVATAIGAFGADNSLGAWKLNVAKSKYSPGPLPYKSLTMIREASDTGVKTTISAQRIDGSRINVSYTAKYDGIAYPVHDTGYPSDTISMKQVDANAFTSEREKPGGKYHTKSLSVISNGGTTMINTLIGTDADGKPLMAWIVYEKQ
jgi:hypothetical protein